MARLRIGDVALAGGLLVASLVEALIIHDANGSRAMLAVVSVVTIVPLMWRRTVPEIAAGGSIVGLLLPEILSARGDDPALLVANLLAMHAINAYGSRRVGLIGSAALLTAVVISIVASVSRTPGDVQWACLLFVLAGGAGQLMAGQARANREAVAAAEREAVAAERRSVAADLHDVIAHGLALMVVQAGAAATVVDTDPRRAKELLVDVQSAGERAAGELRSLLAAVGPGETDSQPHPAHGLTDLTDLIDDARSSGSSIDIEVVGDQARIPDGLSHAGYRIVQEAVTNAVKHAPGSVVRLTVRIDTKELGIVVENFGEVGRQPSPVSGGHGLIAMRERTALFGGTMSAGAIAGGWRTEARFPLDPRSRAGS